MKAEAKLKMFENRNGCLGRLDLARCISQTQLAYLYLRRIGIRVKAFKRKPGGTHKESRKDSRDFLCGFK